MGWVGQLILVILPLSCLPRATRGRGKPLPQHMEATSTSSVHRLRADHKVRSSGLADFSRLRMTSVDVHVHASPPINRLNHGEVTHPAQIITSLSFQNLLHRLGR